MVTLLCLAPAKEGGASTWSSSITVYNEILKRRPDLLEVCGWWWCVLGSGRVAGGGGGACITKCCGAAPGLWMLIVCPPAWGIQVPAWGSGWVGRYGEKKVERNPCCAM